MGISERAGWALGALIVFALLTFVVRGLLQRILTGSWGFVVLRPDSSSAERVVVAGTIAAMATIVVAGVAGVAGNALGGPTTVPASVVAPALVVTAIAIVATFWGQLAMGPSWRVGIDPTEPTALVTSGPFRWVRNPIYAAVVVFHLGLLFVLPGVVMVAGVVLAFIAVELGVRRVEEPFLWAQHGDAFAVWASRTGRFLPAVGCISPTTLET
jgi:protein-S-isoprenylcysteine O-methyltransferase Ste14